MTLHNVTTTDKQQQRKQDPAFITLMANDIVRHEWYETTQTFDDDDDFFPIITKVRAPFVRLSFTETVEETAVSVDVDEDGTMYDNYEEEVVEEMTVEVCEPPERYGEAFDAFVKRARAARHYELVALYHLRAMGVVADIEPGVMDGDTQAKKPDIYVRRAKPNEHGDYSWYAIEVKACSPNRHTFTDDPSTFPRTEVVDNVKAYDEKRKTCRKNETPLLEVLKVNTSTDGMFFISDKHRNEWNQKCTGRHNHVLAYIAHKENGHYRTMNELVEWLGYPQP